jgi:hypothetical protein
VDTTFGSGGISPAFGETPYVPGPSTDVALQSDDRIVLAGTTSGSFALVGMGVDGGLDASFGSAGTFSDAFATTANAVVAYGGLFLAAGGNPQFALARVTTSGALDPTFGSAGRVTTSFGDASSVATAIAVQDDGAMVVVGRTLSSTATSIALARYLGTDLGCQNGPDSDGDGICDDDDECPAGSTFARARLVLSEFLELVCDDRLVFNGTLNLPAAAAIDPEADGVRVIVRDGTDAIVIDQTLPPGAYDDGSETGWRTHVSPRSSTWRFLGAASPGVPLARAALQRRASTPDTLKVVIKLHGVCLVAIPNNSSLAATVVLTPPQALDERCGDAHYPGGSGPTCLVRGGGTKIACR